jgi:hypothetical protein
MGSQKELQWRIHKTAIRRGKNPSVYWGYGTCPTNFYPKE